MNPKHTEPTMNTTPLRNIVALLALMLACLSCKKEEAQSYRAPKDPDSQPRAASPAPVAQADGSSEQLLGAIAVHKDKTWYFKLMGPAAKVGPEAERFHNFVHSLRFTDDPSRPVTWELPSGWKRASEAGGALRYATIHTGEGLELTVIPLEGSAGSPQENINRWRGQIGLDPVNDVQELQGFVETHEVNGLLVMEIDMTGPGGSGGPPPNAPFASPAPAAPSAPRAPFAQGAPPAAGQNLAPVIGVVPDDSPITYTVPEGWRLHEPGGMRKADLSVADGDKVAQTTVIPLGGPAGGLLSNVNRWRGQVGLAPTDAEQLAKEAVEIEVDGIKGHFVDLEGPESAGEKRQRVLGVIFQKGETSWFVKMTGPSGLVGREKERFEALARSIKFKR